MGGYPIATILEKAWVEPTASLRGDAILSGTSWLKNIATVTDHAHVCGTSAVINAAIIGGHAKVRDSSVSGVAKILDQARLIHARVQETTVQSYAKVTNAAVRGYFTLQGHAHVSGKGTLYGYAKTIIEGNVHLTIAERNSVDLAYLHWWSDVP